MQNMHIPTALSRLLVLLEICAGQTHLAPGTSHRSHCKKRKEQRVNHLLGRIGARVSGKRESVRTALSAHKFPWPMTWEDFLRTSFWTCQTVFCSATCLPRGRLAHTLTRRPLILGDRNIQGELGAFLKQLLPKKGNHISIFHSTQKVQPDSCPPQTRSGKEWPGGSWRGGSCSSQSLGPE